MDLWRGCCFDLTTSVSSLPAFSIAEIGNSFSSPRVVLDFGHPWPRVSAQSEEGIAMYERRILIQKEGAERFVDAGRRDERERWRCLGSDGKSRLESGSKSIQAELEALALFSHDRCPELFSV